MISAKEWARLFFEYRESVIGAEGVDFLSPIAIGQLAGLSDEQIFEFVALVTKDDEARGYVPFNYAIGADTIGSVREALKRHGD